MYNFPAVECTPLPTENIEIILLNNNTLFGSEVKLISRPYYKFVYHGSDGFELTITLSVYRVEQTECGTYQLWI